LIGKEQLIIFFVTLYITLKVGLITGISMGVLATFIIHVIINKSFALFLRNMLKPNVLMYREEDNNDNYYISVKHFCNFLNYYRLKEKLNVVPQDKDVIVDFSMCEFVDHTIMEKMNIYQELFDKKKGHLEVVGLDLHGTGSEHPFALRRIIPIPNLLSNFTKRQNNIDELARDYNLEYDASNDKDIYFLKQFIFFRTKEIDHIYNCLSEKNKTLTLFDIEYSEGEFIAKEVVRSSMMHIKLNRKIPEFTLDREGFLEKIYGFAGFNDIQIENHSDFSNRFFLLGEDKVAIKNFFDDELVHFFESNPYYHIESNGSNLLIFGKERLASIKEIKAMLDFGKRLEETINH
ncbi:MAG: SulP family inorganic anion transporter, partial [Flavobacteriaceae bacterium]|nr:SulP family inorganic anion transporter [Flavobacteriaceae bacterium]